MLEKVVGKSKYHEDYYIYLSIFYKYYREKYGEKQRICRIKSRKSVEKQYKNVKNRIKCVILSEKCRIKCVMTELKNYITLFKMERKTRLDYVTVTQTTTRFCVF